ncbi:MAG: hypothetical protein ABI689_07985 [Thermoanaerobaculia bacterium]
MIVLAADFARVAARWCYLARAVQISERLGSSCMAFLALLSAVAPLPTVAQLLGPEYQVNSYTTGDQAYPAIGSDAAGGFVVV